MKNEIKRVEIQGVWKEDPTFVKEVVKELYENILFAIDGLKLRLDNIVFRELTMEDNNMLTRCIEELEIKDAVWQCGSSNSLGPNG